MRKVKLGLISCGQHAFNHAESSKKVHGLEIISSYDPDFFAMKRLEKAYGKDIIPCRSVEELLKTDIDAVFDASPEQFHLSNLESVIKAGKHAFVEKPLIVSAKQIKELKSLLQEAKRKKLVVTSCHIRRFDPPYVWLKNELDNLVRDLGPVVSIDMDFSYHSPSSSWKHGRSLLSDHANHEIDYVNHLFGHRKFSALKVYDSFNRYELTGIRRDYISFKFLGTRRLKKDFFLETIRVRFDHGAVSVDTKRGIAEIMDHNNYPAKPVIKKIGKTDYDKRLIGVMNNFVQCINGKEGNYLTGTDLLVNNYLCAVLEKQNSATINPEKI